MLIHFRIFTSTYSVGCGDSLNSPLSNNNGYISNIGHMFPYLMNAITKSFIRNKIRSINLNICLYDIYYMLKHVTYTRCTERFDGSEYRLPCNQETSAGCI
jgi:hypothetical protein